jgi:hypothetical protein
MALFVAHAEGMCVLQPHIYNIFLLKDSVQHVLKLKPYMPPRNCLTIYVTNITDYFTVKFWELETWKVFKECSKDQVGIRLERVYDSKTGLIPCTSLFLSLSALHTPQVSRYGNWTVA